ncbi:Peptidase A1 domain-containing protein [Aphelenchoides bicaudatus]|nr:Peptidase A1 domain-containing protein [Aphelenchoides bicaudatus]
MRAVLFLAIFLVHLSYALLVVPIKKARVSNGAQSTPLNSYDDSTYVGVISVGTPPKEFNVVFGTVDSNFWLVDSSCSDQQCSGYPEAGYTKNKYDKDKSSTSISTVILWRLAATPFPNQTFGAATSLPQVFGYVMSDGVVGLGLSSKNDKISPVIQNIVSQLPEPVFTMFLDRHIKPSKGSPGGSIVFGSENVDNCDSDIFYTPVTSDTYWQFSVDKIQFDTYVSQKSSQAISDASTDFLAMPTTPNCTQFPCDGMQSSPKILITIAGKELFVDNFEYILDYELGGNKCVVAIFDISDTSYSVDYLLSEPFIRSYCTSYSITDKKIGFARAQHRDV